MTSEHADVPRPRMLKVIFLLLIAAITLSYLGAYGVSGMLVNAEIIPGWNENEDPRPEWMVQAFLAMCGIFCFGAAVARLVSFRQMKRLDEITD